MKPTRKISYLFHIILLQLKAHKRLNLLLVFSLVLGMIIPIFIFGNMNQLKNSIEPIDIKNPEITYVLDTQTSGILKKSDIEKIMRKSQIDSYTYSLMGVFNIAEIQQESLMVSGKAKNSNQFFKPVKTNENIGSNLGRNECFIDQKLASKNQLEVGDTISILGDKYQIKELTKMKYNQVLLPADSFFETLENHHAQAQLFLYFEAPNFNQEEFEQQIKKVNPRLTYSLQRISDSTKKAKASLEPILKAEELIIVVCFIFIIINLLSIMSEKAMLQAKFLSISRALGLSKWGFNFIIFGELLLIMLVAYLSLMMIYSLIVFSDLFKRQLLVTSKEYLFTLIVLSLIVLIGGLFSIIKLTRQPIYSAINKKEVI